MAAGPIDLSAYKVHAGEALAAAKVANGFTAIESWSGSAIDPQAMLQKDATVGQVLVWDGSKWTPGDGRYPMAPTILGRPPRRRIRLSCAEPPRTSIPIPNVVVPTTITRLCLRDQCWRWHG